MLRLYLPIIHLKNNQILITDDKAHYLTSVLRCKKGEDLIIFDGEGNCFRTVIVKADRREVNAEIIEKFPCNTESSLHIILVQGLLKGEKMDMVVQKTTELGVKEILPAITERSQLRETRKVARWKKIAEEASRQSGRSAVPIVHEPINFNDCLLSLVTRYTSLSLNGFIFYEEGGMKLSEAISSFITRPSPLINPPSSPFSKGGQRGIIVKGGEKGTVPDLPPERSEGVESGLSPNVFVIIGPEGGFTKEEVNLAKGKGLIVTSLGKRILRAETAAISAVTLLQFLLGDMG